MHAVLAQGCMGSRVASRAEVVLRQRLEQREERIRELKDTAAARGGTAKKQVPKLMLPCH